MPEPLITALITAHNYGRFIDDAIASVLAQDFPSERRQVLVIDDGSTDDTRERVKKYGSAVEYVYKENGGQASALNLGFEKSRGDIVALLDADDLFLPGKLEKVTRAFEQNSDLGLVYHRLRQWEMTTDTFREAPDFAPVSGDIHALPDIFRSYVPQPTSCISFRKSALAPFLPVPENIRMMADCFPVTLMPFRSPILAIPESLAIYRFHGSNSFHTDEKHLTDETRRHRLQMWEAVIAAMRDWLKESGCENQLSARFLLDRWELALSEERFQIDPPSRTLFFRYLLKRNSYFRPMQTWKFTALNYVSSPLALLLGFKGAGSIDRLRQFAEKIFRAYLRADRPTTISGAR